MQKYNKPPTSYCFGAGREAFNKVVLSKLNLQTEGSNPGPGSYNPHKPLGSDALQFKMKHKINYGDTVVLAVKNNFPCPGYYDQKPAIDSQGIYHKSDWKSSKAARWNPPYDRFKTPITTPQMTPGPGSHDMPGEIHKGI